MGGFLGRYKEHREQSGKRMGSKTQISPVKPKKRSYIRSKKSIDEADTMKSGWTTAQLTVPSSDSLANIKSQIVDTPPVPPPRKQKIRRQTLERQKIVEKLEQKLEQASPALTIEGDPYKHLVPVEEPIIVPKKEPVHICDGDHHHVCNMIHGKVIHDNHIHASKAKVVQRPPPLKKALSTVSLPNYDELKPKKKEDSVRKKPPAKIVRNISMLSLPTESKITLSATTAARLDNYMKRCRSFQGLEPKQLLEKLQDTEVHSDSDDSWDGMNAWDMELHPHQSTPLKSPYEPKFRLEGPLATRNIIKKQETPSFKADQLKPFPTHVLREIAERRESIDDFFETKATNPCEPETEDTEEPSISLGRRGSDAFFNDTPVLLDKDSLKSNIYYTNAFLQSESKCFVKKPVTQNKTIPLSPVEEKINNEINKSIHSISDDLKSSKLVNSLNSSIDKLTSDIEKAPSNVVENSEVKGELNLNSMVEKFADEDKDDLLDTFKEFYSTHDNLSEDSKNNHVTHSNLLKIIQENSKTSEDSDIEKERKFTIPEPLRTAIVDVDRKINKIDAEKQAGI